MLRLLPGLAALALVLGLADEALAALVLEAGTGLRLDDPWLKRALVFTLEQAGLSTALSLGFALPVARALARRPRFPGRGWLLRLFGLPLVMPAIVAVFGLVAAYGSGGWLARAAAAAGLEWPGFPYGLGGILLGHVFFNLPLAVRLLLPLWASVPGETWRLAAQLGMGPWALWRLIEWPLLRQALPGIAALVFTLCSTSFAVVLALGGGPAATTLEVAIYQALRFDFDPPRAVGLALVQLALCSALVLLGQRLGAAMPQPEGSGRMHPRPDAAGRLGRACDALWIALAFAFVGLPLAALVAESLDGPWRDVLADARLWKAAGLSLAIALGAGALALALAFGLLLASRELGLRRHRPRLAVAVEAAGMLGLALPPLVLGTGLFVWLAPRLDVFAWAPALVVAIAALLGLPYALRALGPHFRAVAERHDRLCASLGLAGWNRLRLVEWPAWRQPAALGAALAAALAAGDLGAIALFGTPETATLPLLLYQRLGSYQMGAAAVTAAVLLALCLGLFAALERGLGGRDAR